LYLYTSKLLCKHSNGQIVVIGGSYRASNMPQDDFLPMTVAIIFNTTDRLWYSQTIAALPDQKLPSTRVNHNAVVCK
jgi:hypothetical protein